MKRSLRHLWGSLVLALGVLFSASVFAQATVTHDFDNGASATLQTIDGGTATSLGPPGGNTSNSLTGNTVTLVSGTVSKVYGASNTSNNNTVSGNHALIKGGTATGAVYGGSVNRTSVFAATDSATASNNTVIIEGGTLNGDVYGGRANISGLGLSLRATASNNTVTIKGAPTFGSSVRLHGGVAASSASFIGAASSAGNALEFSSIGLSVIGVANFQTMKFYLPEGLANNGTMLTVTGTTRTDLTGITFGVDAAEEGGLTNMAVGNKYTLIAGVQGTFTEKTGQLHTGHGYKVFVNNNDLVLEVTSLPPTYGIWHSVTTGEMDFGQACEGYVPITAKKVLVKNIGNQPTGELTIALSGDNAESFTLSSATIDSLENYKEKDGFTIKPNDDLDAGSYEATVTISSADQRVAPISFTVRFTVDANSYGIAHDVEEGGLVFEDVLFAYDPIDPKTVQVSNTGNVHTGALAVALSGPGNGEESNFTISENNIANGIDASADGAFKIAPKDGLMAGTYTETVTITGDNGISASFQVTFTVEMRTAELSITQTPLTVFTGDPVYYEAVVKNVDEGFSDDARNVVITHTIPGNISDVSWMCEYADGSSCGGGTLSGADSFMVTISDLPLDDFVTITVSGTAGNVASTEFKTTTAEMETGTGQPSFASAFSSLTVIAKTWSVSHDVEGNPASHDFGRVIRGYGEIDPLTVTVTNTGNQPTGNLSVALSGPGNGEESNFTISENGIDAGLAVNDFGSFKIAPKNGLLAGTYTETVTITGANVVGISFSVSFAVIEPPAALVFGGAYSRKEHGTVGTFDLPINLTGSIELGQDITVEPRSGGSNGEFDLVFKFDYAVDEVIGGVNGVTLSGSGADTAEVDTFEINDNEVIVYLTNVSDATRLGISLVVSGRENGVVRASNTPASANIGFLFGDVNGDRQVDVNDVLAILLLTQSGASADEDNFLNDVDANNQIDINDVLAVSVQGGGTLQ
ncbi:MAG: hypothetical protein FWC38_07000 [Proteobacteria bacterium]|nr:hypothetical protein [Pseudomonadota bacterium]